MSALAIRTDFYKPRQKNERKMPGVYNFNRVGSRGGKHQAVYRKDHINNRTSARISLRRRLAKILRFVVVATTMLHVEDGDNSVHAHYLARPFVTNRSYCRHLSRRHWDYICHQRNFREQHDLGNYSGATENVGQYLRNWREGARNPNFVDICWLVAAELPAVRRSSFRSCLPSGELHAQWLSKGECSFRVAGFVEVYGLILRRRVKS